MTSWMLNTIGLLAVTIGALFVFLHLHRTSKEVSDAALHKECAPLIRDRRMLMIMMGLMAAWFVVQYAALILI
jgi:hypothetical protein